MTTRPAVFIGSSREGIDFARAVRRLLSDDADIKLWNEGFFDLGPTYIETLTQEAGGFDFAILIFTPDDVSTIRDVEQFSPRDNVVFELGLFIGTIGRERTVLLHQADGAVKIPSDLAGVTSASYRWAGTGGEHIDAVGSACDDIRRTIRRLGISETKVGQELRQLASVQDEQAEALQRQQTEIKSVQFALRGIVTRFELEKLVRLNRDQPFPCRYTQNLIDELRRLRTMDMVRNREGMRLGALIEQYRNSNVQFDLKKYVEITDQGREYLKLLSEISELNAPLEAAEK